jgi:hypothetical protein
MSEAVEGKRLRCSDCGCAIDCCQFCDEEACPKAICYMCVIVSIGQEIRQPHPHGG